MINQKFSYFIISQISRTQPDYQRRRTVENVKVVKIFVERTNSKPFLTSKLPNLFIKLID
ncbi:hypothetical protein GCM10023187_45800 [Nibrella viscosa]|uniref:Uncharacterized protein n=1 Tax=Nibrella viscosa TaxID=1084524 RepID=A0ABP8KTI1_9BACT